MNKFTAFCIASLCYFHGALALEQADRMAIEKTVQDYTEAWNERDCRGFGDHYSEIGDFVNIFGMKFSGRAEIEKRHVDIMKSFLKGSKMETLNMSVREVNPGLVIANVFWRVHGFRTPGSDLSSPGETREGVFTHVFVQQHGKWEITASQNTLKPK